jgi:Xaa-Pro aminopeptidase
MHAPLDAHYGHVYLITAHSINALLTVGKGRGDINLLPGAEAYPAVHSHPAFMADLVLEPGMCFVLEPQYAFGGHLPTSAAP